MFVTAVRRLNRGYRSLSPQRLRDWWARMGRGLLAVFAITGVLVYAVRWLEGRGLLAWEASWIAWLEARVPISFSSAMWLEGIGNGFVLWAVVLYAATVAALHHRPLRALSFLVGHTAAYLPITLGWVLWSRPRPRIILDGAASPGGVFHAFPSGHMVQSAFALGLLLALWLGTTGNRAERAFARTFYLLLILLIGFGRLRIGVHWPSDIVGGGIIGASWAWMVAAAGGLGSPPMAPPAAPCTEPDPSD